VTGRQLPSHIDMVVAERGEFTVVALRGQFDYREGSYLRELLLDLAVAPCQRLILDVQLVEFFDSFCLGVLTWCLKRMRDRLGTVEFVCTGDKHPVIKLLGITGIGRVFPVHASLEQARAYDASMPGVAP
jgi:anti-sigma B factor antagonist